MTPVNMGRKSVAEQYLSVTFTLTKLGGSTGWEGLSSSFLLVFSLILVHLLLVLVLPMLLPSHLAGPQLLPLRAQP